MTLNNQDNNGNAINAAAVRAEAAELISRESQPEEPTEINQLVDSRGKTLQPLKAVRMSEIEAKDVEWLWRPFLALGTFNILEGEEGIGKTFLVCALATAIAAGKGLPMVTQEEHIQPSNVLLISAEDSLEYVLKPRLKSMSAQCDRIVAIEEPFTLNRDGILRLSFTLAEYAPKFVVLDPLFSYAGSISLDRDNEIRSVTDELKRLAEKHNCCIVGIRHIGKSKGFGDARNAGLNGVGWRASARSVLLIGKNPENEHQKALCQTKNNLAPKFEKSIGFAIQGDNFLWTGESDLTAMAMLTTLRAENGEERTERQDAKGFLRDALLSGEQLTNDILAEAKQCGISERTLHRAKKELRIDSRKEGFGRSAKWYWSLPEDCQKDVEDCHINNNGNLKANHSNKNSFSNNLAEDCQINNRDNVSNGFGKLKLNLHGKVCANCSKEVQSYSQRCPHCGELPEEI